MGNRVNLGLLLLLSILYPTIAIAQSGVTSAAASEAVNDAVASLKLRSIGPAFMGGRIADIAVHPTRSSTWYIAVGSGGVWKTENAGTTWTPVFDDQKSYSTGCVAIDPANPERVWVGTGENVSGRHVGWGDGVYRSDNGGATWTAMGLATSEHIGKILIDPRDSDVVFVAAEGPLWASGGERGLWRTTDGGDTWVAVLELGEDTGVTDVEFDPSNPDVLYAAAYQRRRHVASLLAGGPLSGIYRSTDGGENWSRSERGLPSGDMGKIGLAVTPADPSRVYATIEANEKERGFYRSDDRGVSWKKRNSYVSGGTGPHYYQEIEASSVDPDLVYQMDVFLHVTRDGGATFDYLETGRAKHSDNHALCIDPRDGLHLLAGTDAGLYESFDEGKTWRHFPNLPVSQFYKVALDDAVPFFNVLAGAQDLGTLFGPSRTMHVDGVRNKDWYVPLGADGYGVAFDPSDNHVMYMEYQEGELFRVDRRTNETLGIKPIAGVDDPPERWNWDSPLLISPHAPGRLYFGSQRLWRSEDRGNSWEPISGDLTTDEFRYDQPAMGRVWGVDALHDTRAMSKYATLTAVSESPLVEGLLYVGSDDGLLHVSEDGGKSWRAAGVLPGVPERSFTNDIEASVTDADHVFAIVDAHKVGDFQPYVFESPDRGRTWKRISGDLPAGTIAWAIQQDHEDPDLLFLGAEFGLHVSLDRGAHWNKLGGAPTIAFRDVKIHRRDDAVVGATFGRGIYILDDLTPLRAMAADALTHEGLMPVRDAWWYVPSEPGQAAGSPTLGSDSYRAENPPFGATLSYFLAESRVAHRASRREEQRRLRESGEDATFPGYEVLRQEALEKEPRVVLTIADEHGPVRRIEGPASAGLHQLSWDLRRPAPDPVEFVTPGFRPPWASTPSGPLVPPGAYRAELSIEANGEHQSIGSPQYFFVLPVQSAGEEHDFVAAADFQSTAANLMREVSAASRALGQLRDQIRHLRAAWMRTPRASTSLGARIGRMEQTAQALGVRLSGDGARSGLSESDVPSIRGRIGRVISELWKTRQPPTETHARSLEQASLDYNGSFAPRLKALEQEVSKVRRDLIDAGAPWTPGAFDG